MIWAKEETMSRAEIEAIQLKRLKETVRRVYEKVEPYRRKMEEAGIKPEDIRTLKDLEKLPFTTKQDMRDNYPYGLFAVPLKKLRRIHASSGTTGKPTVVGYTEQDLEVWKECVARLAAAAGGTEDDIAQICFGYGMFTGALGLHCGLEKLGAAIIPSSTGNTQKQLMYMKDFGATLLVATPSYAMRIAEVAKEIGIDPKKDLKVKTLVLGSELMTEAMRKELHKVWGEDAKITQNYGMSELMGPGVSGECQELNGMHINEDHFIAEVIDPKTGQVLPEEGVYAALAEVEGQTYRAVTNVGTRPSVDSDSRQTVESLLLGYTGDLYGKEMELAFYRRLRGIQKFPSLQAVKEQVDRDRLAVNDFFDGQGGAQ